MEFEARGLEKTAKDLNERDPRWLLAKRISRSRALSRSERLPRLLLYICRMYLAEREEELNEQRIGIAVFGRAPSYDPAVDSIVRSHATRLRQRLELYFSTEGASEPLRLEIPRGGYLPKFFSAEEVPIAEPVLQPIPIDPSPESAPSLNSLTKPDREESKSIPQKLIGWGIAFASGLLVAFLLTGHIRPHAAARETDQQTHGPSSIERKFWESFLGSNRRTLLVTGDSGLVLYETYAHTEISLSQYLSGSYLQAQPSWRQLDIPSQTLADLGGRRYTSMVDLELITKLTHLPGWSNTGDEVVFARDLRSDQLEKANLILVGSRQANPWVSLYEPAMNFVLRRNEKGEFFFVNRHPLAGEKEMYSPSNDDTGIGVPSVYGLIAYLPTNGGQGRVLILGGLWMSGTESAGNFILNDQQFTKFLSSIVQKDGSIPPFELLIRTKAFGGNAVTSAVVAQRVGGAENYRSMH